MRTVAYLYSDPLLDRSPDPDLWGWDVDWVYQDIGDRHQLAQLLQDAATTPIDYVLVRQFDDLGDSVQSVGDRLADFERLGIHLMAVEEPISATEQPLSRSEVLQLLQSLQTRQRSRNIRRGHAQNRVKTLPPPGKAPYGYRRGQERYIIDKSTAPVVKAFFEHFLLYGSLRGSVRQIETKYGKKISPSTGQRWLTSPVYRGDLEYGTGDVVLNTHAAILSRDEAAQVDRLLRRNRRLPSRSASAPRSLAGLVTCATCQSGMTITRVTAPRRAKEYLYLRPMACQQVTVGDRPCRALPYDQVLNKTIERICDELPRAVAATQFPNINQVQAHFDQQLQQKQAVLAQLPELVDSGVLDAATADLRRYNVQCEMADIQRQLAQLPPQNLLAIAQTVALPQFWLGLSEAERRFYFREFIQQINIARPSTAEAWELHLNFIF